MKYVGCVECGSHYINETYKSTAYPRIKAHLRICEECGMEVILGEYDMEYDEYTPMKD